MIHPGNVFWQTCVWQHSDQGKEGSVVQSTFSRDMWLELWDSCTDML